MIAINRSLVAWAERYLLARDVSAAYAEQVRGRIAAYADWCGRDVLVSELCCDEANAWLADLSQSGLSPRTVIGYRQALLSVWLDALRAGEPCEAPLRLRKIRKPRLIIEAYTREEIMLLLRHAARLKGRLADGNARSDFWRAAIHVAYSCGPRRGDLLSVRRDQVSPDGVMTFVQQKTGYPVTVRLSKKAIEFASRLDSPSGLLLPWPHAHDWFSRSFTRLRKSAGVTRGTFQWIRRSAGSYAESLGSGNGSRLLGHRCERVFRAHYEDSSITGERPVEPPPL